MNRKERRAQAAKSRKNEKGSQAKSHKNVEERLHDAIHEAVAKVVGRVSPDDVPHKEIIRGLGMTAAAFAVQLAASLAADPSEVPTLIREGRVEFTSGMGGYYDGIAGAFGVDTAPEPEGPTLILP
jgi:hypothetical protein